MASLKMFDLSGRVAAVTGGNRGIGRGIALGPAQAGASVAVLARNQDHNRGVVEELRKLGVPAFALPLDVRKRADLQPAIAEVQRALGPLDILVNNAGIAFLKRALDADEKSWDRVIETNLTSVFLLSQLAARSMVKRGRGKIINLASEYAIFGSGVIPSYSASKGAVVQLTKSMAIDLAPQNIQVNALLPGWIDTDLTAPVKQTTQYDEIITRTPAGRFGTPDEIAGAAIFLASDASNFVTGTVVTVDGGYSAR
ncbi:MAG TPA: glucose 1-dehydrogenase [Candidatus Binataceae bacterium]|nr:glucose 1-dehydrogenase [Candidatus Binataceae bacterium]